MTKNITWTTMLIAILLACLVPTLGCLHGDGNNEEGDVDIPGDDDDDDIGDDDDDDDDIDPYAHIPRFKSVWDAPTESTLPAEVDSCATYQETACVAETLRRCDIYDAAEKGWDSDPTPMLEQMFWYDRYYDLYMNMEGQHADRFSTIPMAPGTPESVWGDPQYFERYDGYGDASGWTGNALQAAAARYKVTGTEADYQRMLKKTDQMMFLYEATEIPGLLMRSHFAMLLDDNIYPVGNPDKSVSDYVEPDDWHYRYPLSAEMLQRLPAYYTEGLEILGVHHDVTPLWMGDASRDMYVRSLPGVMAAYDMLGEGQEEERLRNLIETEIPCSLNRMKKIRISNLQSNELIKEFVNIYLGGGRMLLDPDDIQFTDIDTVVGYVMEQPNPDYMDHFDGSCPAGPPLEVTVPEFELDAGETAEFLIQFFALTERMDRDSKNPIAWILVPGLRGGDIAFMTQWAMASYYFTGDESYLQFMDEMMKEMEYWPLLDTMGSFYNPKWCAPTFAPSLIYPTLWNIQSRIDKLEYPDFWNDFGTVIYEEEKSKEVANHGDALFGILYDNMVDSDIDPDVDDYVAEMVEVLRGAEQYQAGPERKFEPRRNYPNLLHSDPPPEFDLPTEEPTQEEIDICLQEVELFGMVLFEGWIEDTLPRAVDYLPLKWRVGGAMQFAMGPYMLERTYGGKAGRVMWPMQGLTAAFWTGSAQSTITDAEGYALGWHDTGEACPK